MVQAVSTARVLATRSANVKPEFENAEGEAIDAVTREVPENTAARRPVGARIVAKDPENDTLTYTLDGTDAALRSPSTAGHRPVDDEGCAGQGDEGQLHRYGYGD